MLKRLALALLALFSLFAVTADAAETLRMLDVKIVWNNCTDAPMRIITKDYVTNEPLRSDVKVQMSVVEYGMWTDVFMNWTDSVTGEVAYTPLRESLYMISVSRPGYQPFVTTIGAKFCPECRTDFDCGNTQRCDGSKCVNLTGECGFATDHVWYEYECCADAACASDQYCFENKCKTVTGVCGYAADHTWHPYTCCSNSDCGEREDCIDHACVARTGCLRDSECLDSQRCSGSVCVNIVGECGYAANHMWNGYQCCNDADCASGRCLSNHSCAAAAVSPLATPAPPIQAPPAMDILGLFAVAAIIVVVVAAVVLLPIISGRLGKSEEKPAKKMRKIAPEEEDDEE